MDVPLDRFNKLCKGFSYIEYSNPEEAENAMKHMDGGKKCSFTIKNRIKNYKIYRSN